MRHTIKHYFYFGDKSNQVGENLLAKDSWDSVRTDDDVNSPFSIPRDRSEWVRKCLEQQDIIARAQDIVELTKVMDLPAVVSVGVGCAWLEFNIKRLNPTLNLTCTDFTPKSVERLSHVFHECDAVFEFDMLRGGWKANDGAMYLLHRVDSEFDDEQWKNIFAAMNAAGIRWVLFVPAKIVTLSVMFREKLSFIRHRVLGRQVSFAGYYRTSDALRSLFAQHYALKRELRIGDLQGFLLQKI